MKTVCLSAYTIGAYLSVLDDLEYAPMMRITIQSEYDRTSTPGIPYDAVGLLLPEQYYKETELDINLESAFDVITDYTLGCFMFNLKLADGSVFRFRIPVEHICKVFAQDVSLEFDLTHEEPRFITREKQPVLRLVK